MGRGRGGGGVDFPAGNSMSKEPSCRTKTKCWSLKEHGRVEAGGRQASDLMEAGRLRKGLK